ncbi:MAG: precorrin-3B C(17)-methyltransferase [Clostridiales bacterium]|nr:precorrin-3B C(17)-methyltransferase [Clostridiales bacterium]
MSKINVVGIGPGAYEQMTGRAIRALKESDEIIGYTVYVDLVKEYFPDKEFRTTPMKKEEDRCVLAFEEARKGKNVSMICSGDAGVYGMAGLMYQVGEKYPEVELTVIPGVTAATGGAAVLGAPLIHDFCLISLSDLLTPWEKIEARLLAAAQADFVICLYNPSSRKRSDYLQKACDLILTHRSPDTVCGTVARIAREGEEARVLTLGELRNAQVDMFTTVFIGNSQTREIGGKMVTPRGYESER